MIVETGLKISAGAGGAAITVPAAIADSPPALYAPPRPYAPPPPPPPRSYPPPPPPKGLNHFQVIDARRLQTMQPHLTSQN